MSILKDHQQSGKRLVPPFVHILGEIEEVSWIRQGLPEYLWIALVQALGSHSAVETISSFARLCRQSRVDLEHQTFAASSAFIQLQNQDAARIREILAASGLLFELQAVLRILIAAYPSCPLRWLFSEQFERFDPDRPALFDHIGNVVAKLYDRTGLLCTNVQATAVALAFDADMLKVREGLSLSHFPRIEDYPHTEISRKVAGAIRGTVIQFLASAEFVPKSDWPTYFWNRSYSETPCKQAVHHAAT